MSSFPHVRPRRLRANEAIRALVQETSLGVSNLIYPLFVMDGKKQKQEISSMPGCFRFSMDLLLEEIKEAYDLGLRTFALFPVIDPKLKSEDAKESYNPEGLIPRTLRVLKKSFNDICLITDVALDPFTSHGHDGLVDSERILNDETVEVLCKMALVQAHAGTDIVAPSDMMDGRVKCIREYLDKNEHSETLILSYSAKFASGFYGPFRDALSSNLKFGDKKTYQLDPANAREAEKEILLDTNEGADMLMVKPGLAYLDILYRASQITHLPLIVYSVSGEYSMIKAACANGSLDEQKVVMESMLAFRRAGARGIITYHAKDIAGWLKDLT
ncbi:MAG: porphobilinogen synthase [Candidatus Caenarcaniphilales bacterium]|nr:porphobilinogen synthase [Candidatus Caenarcaniphilales bacterium]